MPRTTRSRLALPCCGLLTAALAVASPAAQPVPVDSLAAAFFAEAGVPSLVVGVLDGGERAVYAYGAADSLGTAPDAHTLYEIGSVTKGLVGLALAALVAEGTVSLDDPLSAYLPDSARAPAFDGAPVRLGHLATHTSGLPRIPFMMPADFRNPYAGFGEADLMRALAAFTPDEAPGEGYGYSNLGAGLLAYLLARREGTTVEGVVRERVLAPLGMDETAVALPDAWAARLAPATDAEGGPLPHWTFTEALVGAGGFRSSAHDLLTLAEALLDPASSPLPEDVVRLATTSRFTTDRFRIGLFWHLLPVEAGTEPEVVFHNGATFGMTAFLGVVPETGVGMVVLANGPAALEPLAFGLLARLSGAG